MGSLSPLTSEVVDGFNDRPSNAIQAQECDKAVALVGMGCRWPGKISDPSQLWEFLASQKTAYSKFPSNRFNTEAFFHQKLGRPGSFYADEGCFLEDPYNFDPTFFGVNPLEAASIDPSQRKLLEVVYESFESAGVSLTEVSGSNTGCFVGNFIQDHQLMQHRDPEYPPQYSVTGSGLAMLSNRLSYIFNLKGPSVTLDTACSSSLYALHLACSAILAGDCEAAVVAGANLILTPDTQLFSSELGAISPTSRCHTFDIKADGYARAEGVAALYLKKVKHAIENGDPIRAIVRGTSINANGKTGGITRPSVQGQEAVIRHAYERAGIDPSSTSFVECHGTGTQAGDPLEVAAISAVFGNSRTSEDPLLLGAVKPNLGHSEATSGILGIMKIALALEHDFIPATVGLKTLNPRIDLKNGALKIITENSKWPSKERRIASVNSFGYGGANAHAILESAKSFLRAAPLLRKSLYQAVSSNGSILPNGHSASFHENAFRKISKHSKTQHDTNGTEKRLLLVFSAHNKNTLEANFRAISKSVLEKEMCAVAETLSCRRSKLAERMFVVARESDTENVTKLIPSPSFHVLKNKVPRIAFVFTGQGVQWQHMGTDLIQEFATCRETLLILDRHLQSLQEPPSWTLKEILTKNSHDINRALYAQASITCVQIMIIDLLSSWGVHPQACVGHSSGEIAAAYAAGLLDERESIILAYLRGLSMEENQRRGSMLSVGLGSEEFLARFERLPEGVVIACYNSPKNITLSGSEDQISTLSTDLEISHIFCRTLRTDGNAYHSPALHPVGKSYAKQIDKLCPTLRTLNHRQAKYPFFSTVTDNLAESESLKSDYWVQNLLSPVRFEQAITKISKQTNVDIFLEIGPHTALQTPLRDTLQKAQAERTFQILPTMKRDQNSVDCLLSTAGSLWTADVPVDVSKVNQIHNPFNKRQQSSLILSDLPPYQWQYNGAPYLRNRWTEEWCMRKHPRHDILGSQVPGGPGIVATWRNILRREDVDWLDAHQIGGHCVFPAAGYIAMVLEAATQYLSNNSELQNFGRSAIEMENIVFEKAIVVPEKPPGLETFLTLLPATVPGSKSNAWRYEFIISSVASHTTEALAEKHCSGQITYVAAPSSQKARVPFVTGKQREQRREQVTPSAWYDHFADLGMVYGDQFQCMQALFAVEGSASATLTEPSPEPDKSSYYIHPTTLDSALQLCLVARFGRDYRQMRAPMIPYSIRRITIPANSARPWELGKVSAIAAANSCGVRALRASLEVSMGSQALLDMEGGIFKAFNNETLAPKASSEPFSFLKWVPDMNHADLRSVKNYLPKSHSSRSSLGQRLEELALFQIIHLFQERREYFEKPHKTPHLNKFLQWTKHKVETIIENSNSQAKDAFTLTTSERAAKIETMSSDLCSISSEARMLCHIYQFLDEIMSGNKSGIEVALEGGRLDALYKESERLKQGNKRLGEVMRLFGQQNPEMRILEVGAGTGSATAQILPHLSDNHENSFYQSYAFTDVSPSFLNTGRENFGKFEGVDFFTFNMEEAEAADKIGQGYDIVVGANVVHATSSILNTLQNLRKLLKPGGKLVLLEFTKSLLTSGLLFGTFSDFWKGGDDPVFPRHWGPFLSKEMWLEALPQAGFEKVDFILDDDDDYPSCSIICATVVGDEDLKRSIQPSEKKQSTTVVVYEEECTETAAFVSSIEQLGKEVDVISLAGNEIPRSPDLVFLLEIQKPVFPQINEHDLKRLQTFFRHAHSILWITRGDLMKGNIPQYNMITGVANAIRLERADLKFTTVDIGRSNTLHDTALRKIFDELMDRYRSSRADSSEQELRYDNGVLYCSRLVPDKQLNSKHAHACGHSSSTTITTKTTTLASLEGTTLELTPDPSTAGSNLTFQSKQDAETIPKNRDQVEIEVKVMNLSPENLSGLTGEALHSRNCDECMGVVKSVPPGVETVKLGDHVWSLAFGKCQNRQWVPPEWCRNIGQVEIWETNIKSSPASFCTAVRALEELALLGEGETLLLTAPLSNVGLASIQICSALKAQCLVLVENQDEIARILEKEPSLSADQIFLFSDPSCQEKVKARNEGRAVDVVLSNVPATLAQGLWPFLGSGGRFINIKKRDDPAVAIYNSEKFSHNCSYHAFDLEEYARRTPEKVDGLMRRVHQRYVNGQLRPIDIPTVQLSSALDENSPVTSRPFKTNVILSWANVHDEIKIRPPIFESKFSNEASYLLVGGLSEVNRMLSSWMLSRGAKNFIFLGRSGVSTEDQRLFLNDLTDLGAHCDVVSGDVSRIQDVQKAVDKRKYPVRGVIQGALALKDQLFETMDSETWNQLTKIRVQGTINLHETLADQPLDFFLMFSSVSAIFGNATQSQYLASSAFMDNFARYRRGLGLPATSLNLGHISETGAVSRIPGAAKALTRQGLYPNSRDDFLQFCDAALMNSLRQSKDPNHRDENLAEAQVVAGVGPGGLMALGAEDAHEQISWYTDPRFTYLWKSVRRRQPSAKDSRAQHGNVSAVASTLEQIVAQLAILLYMPAEEIDTSVPISRLGIDSMVAAELRRWLFKTFGKDVSTIELLDGGTSVAKLDEYVTKEVSEKVQEGLGM